MSILAVEHLEKSYSGFLAVKDVSFSLQAGEMLALIGPNGAGKSTCFNMINGQLRPTAGRIRIFGRDVTGLAPREIWRLGRRPHLSDCGNFRIDDRRRECAGGASLTSSNTGRAAGGRRVIVRQEANDLLALVGMEDQASRSCGELAYGDVKRLEFAVALANDPKLLLMDEPAAGMAPSERAALMTL